MERNDYDEKSAQIRQLAALPPDQFANHLSTLHPHISTIAPNLAPHVFSSASNAVQFLNSKLPHVGNELIQDKSPGPSIAQKTAWLDLHKVVNDPTSILEHVNNSTLNSHHIQAMQSVYPDLHQEMVQKVTQELGARQTSEKPISYQKRLSISKFIGQPVDSTFTQQSMQAILNSASQNTGPQAQAIAAQKSPKRATGAELEQIDKVNQIYKTPAQARETMGKET